MSLPPAPSEASRVQGNRRDVVVRLLSRGEAQVLDHVAQDVFDHAVVPDHVAEFLGDPRSMIAVALDGKLVVGMATGLWYVHPDKPRQLFVNEVGVAPSHQRRGIAKRLVALLLDRAREIGCAEAWVATEENNVAARAVYGSLGGREDAARAIVYVYDLGAKPAG